MNRLPALLKGIVSKIKLMIADNTIKFSILICFINLLFLNKVSVANVILLSAIISLLLETMPLRSPGSIFTTNNATYLILIASIVLSYKKILKIKIE